MMRLMREGNISAATKGATATNRSGAKVIVRCGCFLTSKSLLLLASYLLFNFSRSRPAKEDSRLRVKPASAQHGDGQNRRTAKRENQCSGRRDWRIKEILGNDGISKKGEYLAGTCRLLMRGLS